jgi:hypothetical protein
MPIPPFSSPPALYKENKISIVVGKHGDPGYVTDGVDDQVQFNQAYTDLASGGYTGPKRIIAPDQTYNITDSINVENGIWLQGSGTGPTTFAASGSFPGVFTYGGSSGSPLTDAGFSDFKIDGTNMDRITYDTSHKGFYFTYTLRLKFQNIYVYNTPATGFGNDFNVDCQFDNCIAEECGANGFPGDPGYNGFGFGTGGYTEESIQLTNCFAINCGNNGFLFERQFDVSFSDDPRSYQLTNCYAIGCKRGFMLTGTSGTSMVGCKAINSVSHGFFANTLTSASPPLDLQLADCEARGNGGVGFYLGDDQRFARIMLNNCHSTGNTGGDGFRVAGDHLKITNCESWLNRDAGFDIHPQGLNNSNSLTVKFAPIQAVILRGNTAWDNGQSNSNGTTEGFLLSGATSRIKSAELVGNHAYDDQATATQLYGIHVICTIDNLSLIDNKCYGHKSAGIFLDGAVRGPSSAHTIQENHCYNNGRAGGTASSMAGIRLDLGTNGTLDGVIINDNTCYDNQNTLAPDATNIGLLTSSQPASGVLTGDYLYKVTFTNATGETAGGTTSAVVSPSSGQVGLVIPQGPNGSYAITGRNIYRTASGGADGTQKLLAIVANNTTTTYADNIPDGSLGAAVPTTDTSGTGIVPTAPDAHIKMVDSPVSGNLSGAYIYKVTFVTGIGESAGGTTSNSITASSNQMNVTNIAIGPAGTTARKLYRTAGGGADGTQKLVTTISDNTTVVYADNIPDGSLGAAVPTTGNAFSQTQQYGLRLAGTITNAIVNDNDFRNNATDAVSNGISSNARFSNNKGWNPEIIYAQGNVTGATTFDRTNGDTITATLIGNITPTLSGGKSYDDRLTLVLTQDSTGSRTASSWSSNAKFAQGGLTLSTAANAVDVITFIWDGTNWREQSRALATAVFSNPMTAAGDIIYGGTAGAATRLADGTATQLLHSGTTPSWSAVSLTADVTNTLPVANGGTGVTSSTGTGSTVLSASPALSGTPTAPTAAANTNSTQIATTAYVDGAIAGLDAKDPVAFAQTSALPANTYANGSSGVGATLTGNSNGFLILDGVTLTSSYNGLRVLVAGESTAPNNGWYTITNVGSVITKYVLTRAVDSDQAAEIESGYITGVVAPSGLSAGTNNGKAFISSAPSPFTVGTDSLTFSLVGAAYAAGTGLSLSGVTFSLSTPVSAANGGTGVSNSKNLTVSNSLTLAGTDSTIMTFPSTSATIARIDAAQTFTGTQTFAQTVQTPQTVTVTSNAGTCDVNHGVQNFTNSSAAAMTVTLTTTSAVDGQPKVVRVFDFSAVTQSISWVNTENSTVSAPVISNGSITLPLAVAFQYNSATSKWRCVGVA